MTRAELHNVQGFHPASLIAAAAHLLTLIPRKAASDATSIIRNEGRMNGYLEAIEALKAAALKQPEPAPQKDFAPYSQPAQNENPNRA